MALPFDPDLPAPRNNYSAALAQFKSLERSLLKNKEKCALYTAAIEKYLSDGHAERVYSSHPGKDKRFFLPHHGIWRAGHASTALRVVFNASATDDSGFSLNHALLPGPKLQPDLCDILTRYRCFEYTLTSDIQKMFLQINVDPEQRDYLSFLWRTPGSKEDITVYRKSVVTFGLNCAPWLAIRTVKFHLDKHEALFPKATQLICEQIFVDDVLAGANTIEECVLLRSQMSELMQLGGFRLTKFLANNGKVMLSVPLEDRAAAAPYIIAEKDLSLTPEVITKTLGVQWDPLSDLFEFQGCQDLSEPLVHETMRTLASRAARVFDPLGFCQPVLIQAKRLVQACWAAKLTWNDPLPPEILEPWLQWIKEIATLRHVTIPRLLMIRDAVSIQLHGFSDASSVACAAVVYVRSTNVAGKVQVTLAACKTKLASLKTISVPRLELQAACLLAHLVKKVMRCLGVNDVVLWTDSAVVLCWLNKPPHVWKVFVANRVTQLLEMFPVDTWRHVNTIENIADIPSRGMSAPALLTCKEWFEGPSFLSEPEEFWPKSPFPQPPPSIDLEAKVPESLCLLSQHDRVSELYEQIFANVRPFFHNLRQLAYVNRFAINAQPQFSALRVTQKYPIQRELKNAYKEWARYVQSLHFSEEIAQLRKGVALAKGPLKQLQPFYDVNTGLVHVGGRLGLANFLPEEAIHPIILPAHEAHVERYVIQIHAAHNHVGPEVLLSLIRTRFWLLKGRRECKRILRKYCWKCLRLRATPFSVSMAPLPTGRINPVHAWLRIGLDYFGPVRVLKEKIFPGEKDTHGKV